METIRNYLETMFASLPNTFEMQKAKNELLQMMEDKYTELITDGKTENEAVGIVISEFGNLDELAEELGISSFVIQENQKTLSWGNGSFSGRGPAVWILRRQSMCITGERAFA